MTPAPPGGRPHGPVGHALEPAAGALRFDLAVRVAAALRAGPRPVDPPAR